MNNQSISQWLKMAEFGWNWRRFFITFVIAGYAEGPAGGIFGSNYKNSHAEELRTDS